MKPENAVIKLNRHPQKFLLGIPTLFKKQSGGDSRLRLSGMTRYGTRAFTLVELLVVVLIIGILTAVALPQYQKAVAKSRLAAIKPTLAAIKEANEAYFLEHGVYAYDPKKLAITGCKAFKGTGSVLRCDDYFAIDVIQNENYNSEQKNIRAVYCPDYIETDWTSCHNKNDFVYTLWLDHSTNPNQTTCTPRTTLGTRLCNAINNN